MPPTSGRSAQAAPRRKKETSRYTLDLSGTQWEFLSLFAMRNRVPKTTVMRALIHHLSTNEELQQVIVKSISEDDD